MENYDGEKCDEQAGHGATSGLNGEFRIENGELKSLSELGLFISYHTLLRLQRKEERHSSGVYRTH